MTSLPEKLGPRERTPEKKKFGGKQSGAGRPRKAPHERPVKLHLYLPPNLHGLLVDGAGNERGAVSAEIIHILRLYYKTPQIL